MPHLLNRLMIRVFGPKRVAPGAWQVTTETWGFVSDRSLAKLCVSGQFAKAEIQARDAFVGIARQAGPNNEHARALHDLACVLHVRGHFLPAMSLRKQIRDLVREVMEREFPKVLEFFEDERKVLRRKDSAYLLDEWYRAFHQLAGAESALGDACFGAGEYAAAAVAYKCAFDASAGTGNLAAAESAKQRMAAAQLRASAASRPQSRRV